MSEPEIQKMIVISTSHLTRPTADGMYAIIGAYDKGDYGSFVYVPQDPDEHFYQSLPADLLRCILHARFLGCDWIMFDRDADQIGCLPTYDW